MANQSLQSQLGTVRRRLLLIGSATSLFWGLSAVVVALLTAAWFDLLWELSPQSRIALSALAVIASLLSLILLGFRTAQASRYALVARRVDRALGSGGEILTGAELARAAASAAAAPLTGQLAAMAVAHAARLAQGVPASRAASARPLVRSLGGFVLLLAIPAALACAMPELARTQWNRFFTPFSDVPPFSTTAFVLEPAGKEVLYGADLDIRAAARGAPVDQVDLILEYADGKQERLPMFQEQDGRFRATLAKITAPAAYHVASSRARSKKFRLDVITTPRIEQVRLRITPPEYANFPSYEGPLPKDGIVALRGTTVRVWALSNRPLSGGTISMQVAESPASAEKKEPAAEGSTLEMKPESDRAEEVSGEFAVVADAKFEVRVVDVAGQASQESFAGTVALLADSRPFIRLLEPKPKSLATPSALLPVLIAAEDDCGISSVQFFRNLNESRPLPAALSVGQRPPRRFTKRLELPLNRFNLQPGDVIKLFGRVEDNDPDGAKGAESSVAVVEIISQEDFDRMQRMREGVEMLMSKYRSAQRRMEALAEEMARLQKKLEAEAKAGDVAASEESRRELKRLADRMRKEAAEMRKLADHKLPYDIDRNLSSQLDAVASLPDDVAAELEKLLEKADMSAEAIARQLAKQAKRLADERRVFQENAMLPLDRLAAIFPLIADQSRFEILVMHQQDLADRMAALKGRDREDDPALKARMRDLEQEQRQVAEELVSLLSDIEGHVQRLPEDEDLEELRETAIQFVNDVRQCGAAEAMSEAEAALADFAGTRAFEKAKEAADCLAKLLKQCESMGQGAGGALVFMPGLSSGLGDSVSQLLQEMGLGSGSGSGGGSGNGGGYSARRGFGRNMGMYGSSLSVGGSVGQGSLDEESAAENLSAVVGRQIDNPDQEDSVEMPAVGSAAGAGQSRVPARYRRQVGQYFQRIAEGAEDK